MKKQELENLAKNIINQVIAGESVEDSGIELKTIWIDAEKAARRLAAHANAASGDAIIWLMGVDEKGRKITGVEAKEMSNWIKTIAKQFDGEPPSLNCHANIHYSEGTVIALYFETDASPYVIKNRAGGSPEFEVPYRRGNDTRSASRHDLLQILLPTLKYPTVELLNSKLSVYIDRNQKVNSQILLIDRFDWSFTAEIYLTPRTKDSIVLPHKNCAFHFRISDLGNHYYTLPLNFKPLGKSLTIRHSASEIIIVGPGSIGIEAKGYLAYDSRLKSIVPQGQSEIVIEIKPVYVEKRMIIKKVLKYDITSSKPFAGILYKQSSTWN